MKTDYYLMYSAGKLILSKNKLDDFLKMVKNITL